MVSGTVRLTRQARQDLVDIGRYIAADNPERSETLIFEIQDKAAAYADHPMMGHDRSDLAKDIRSFPHHTYMVFYRPYRNGIQIVRVFSGYRDIQPDMLKFNAGKI